MYYNAAAYTDWSEGCGSVINNTSDALLAWLTLPLAWKARIYGDRYYAGSPKRITPPWFFERYHLGHWRYLRKYRAPVVPYTWVIEKVKRTGCPVLWENPQHSGWVAKYVSELRDGEVVTHVRVGSYKVSSDWLQPL